MGTFYYGDNLDILRRYVADESVDLVYLDPPFNSAQNTNAFFQEKDGTAEEAEGNREAGRKGEQPPRRARIAQCFSAGKMASKENKVPQGRRNLLSSLTGLWHSANRQTQR